MFLKINRDIIASRPTLFPIAETELVAEIGHPDCSLQTENGLEPVIVHEHDREPNSFCDRGYDLGVHHQIGTISNHHDNFALRFRQFYS